MVQGGCGSGRCGAILALALLCLAYPGSASNTTEGPVSSSTTVLSTTADSGPKGRTKEEKFIRREINTLLKELRQVAQAVESVRKEHDRLSKGVSDIGKSVKDMNELSLHIKKKVRKMSKVLNKNGHGHNHKLKDGLKSLKKDHEHIIRAVTSLTLHHRSLYGSTHHKKQRKPASTSGSSHRQNSTDEVLPSPEPEVAEEEDQETSNDIPDLVVEPQETVRNNEVPIPKNCIEVLQMGNYTSGAYSILPKGMKTPIQVWCDHTTDGGGWTSMVARKPQDKQLDFTLKWDDYKNGFGDPVSEHWIGTEALHFMTLGTRHELRINITDWNDTYAWAGWKEFSVEDEEHHYALTVGRYVSSSTAGDALKWHNGMKFSTPDKDNDALMGGHCASKNMGGWWYRGYRGCYQAHPTGLYQKNPAAPPKPKEKRIVDLGPVLAWQDWRGETFFPKTLFLMFRPVP